METTFAAVFVALHAAHQVGDHWIQTERQACGKGAPGWPGRLACARHVTTYTATAVIALLALTVVDVHLDPGRTVAGLTVSAVSHYIADRRTPLQRLAAWTGSGVFYALGAPRPGPDDNPRPGTGAYALDQSYHVLWLFITALIIA